MIDDAPPEPALRGFRLRNVSDAKKIAKYAARGRLNVAHRYLRKSEQRLVGPGQVWAIPTQDGKRWTDGLRDKNDPSSTKRGGFLCYAVPNPPAFPGAVPNAPWIKKRATLKVTGADGVEREWEIIAYDYDAHKVHGLDFRDLTSDIDDLLLPVHAGAASTSTQSPKVFVDERAVSLTPFSPSGSLVLPSPSPSPSSSPSPPTPAERWVSPSDSPLISRKERQLFPRLHTSRLPTRLAESTRWLPYARRRDPYDDRMLSRLDARPWLARDYGHWFQF